MAPSPAGAKYRSIVLKTGVKIQRTCQKYSLDPESSWDKNRSVSCANADSRYAVACTRPFCEADGFRFQGCLLDFTGGLGLGGGEKVVAIVSSRFCTKLNIAPWLHFSVTVIVLKINDVAAGGVRVINLANMILAKTDASFELVCGC